MRPNPDLKAQFMLHLISKVQIPNELHGGDWAAAQDLLIERVSALADKLVMACTPQPPPAAMIAAIKEGDGPILECLRTVIINAGMIHGAKRVHWLAMCEQTLPGGIGRRAFESAANRLLAAGKVVKLGTRFKVAASE